MTIKHQLKAILITEDGENFLCIRQFYVNDLRTGQLIDGKIYQGRKFKLKFLGVLFSHIVKGDLKAEVGLKKIENQWNRMKSKSLLAINFNRFFAARAKENDWVDSKKIGIYNLRPDWKKIFKRSSG